MQFMQLSTLLVLPVLGLVAIPLFLSAWVTVSFALLTLFIRLTIVYLELGYGLVTSYFVIPTSSTSSLLTFALSEPPTPAGPSRRNSGSSRTQSRKTHEGNDVALALRGLSDTPDDHLSGRRASYARSMAAAHDLPATAPLGLVSGDARRDFEGVGGWRSYSSSSRAFKHRGGLVSHEKPSSSVSSSSAHSASADFGPNANADADERAWLSLNQRLELPSHLVTLGSPDSIPASAVNSPSYADADSGNSYPALMPPTTSAASGHASSHLQPGAPRHHHPSRTTSSLPVIGRRSGGGGLSLALSTRPDVRDYPYTHAVSPSMARLVAPFMTPQPYPSSRVYSHAGSFSRALSGPSGPHTTTYLPGSVDGVVTGLGENSSSSGGGYFALGWPGTYSNYSLSGMASPSRSGYTTPGIGVSTEDRDATLHLSRSMAHYPVGVRHRRSSISGPHARRMSAGE
ncbi:hypothetical protein NUU61_009250 [Penicillium alfredii]|uniref:Uncharacterized protein n=1 Tax=Penicillium alfredii TaxID=1506179 RepID=A0A9W9EN18_9EURO|nr:uncharacterized protein NUU61_009250 [Penicillium alfredii]KAJ5084671.1 hypothetical protein NUU61_009250 [Penicillium alfredii]